MTRLSFTAQTLVAVALLCAHGAASASEPALSALFTDHMVFAEGKPMRVFGTGTGRVEVSFDGQEAVAEPSGEDAWCATLPAHAAGCGYALTVNLAGREVMLTDVGVGEVLLMGGQSNMQFIMNRTDYPVAEYADEPLLRCFAVTRPEADKEDAVAAFSASDGWRTCAASEVARWSSLAYLMGMARVRDRHVPVGMVVCAQGASVLCSWLPEELTAPGTALEVVGSEMHSDYTNPAYSRWNQRGFLYGFMFRKVIPFGFTHAVWYQGESDTGRGGKTYYAPMLAAMIARWREDLMDPGLTFTVVQIANLNDRDDENWHGVQTAQEAVPSLCEGVTLVKTADISTSYDIHPKDKTRLAQRLSHVLWKPLAPPEGTAGDETSLDTMVTISTRSGTDVPLDTLLVSFAWSPSPGISLNTKPPTGLFILVR